MKKLDENCKEVLILGTELLKNGVFACIDVKDKLNFAENDNTIQDVGETLQADKPFAVK